MLALPPASQPAPRRQVFVGTAVAGAAGFMLIGGMMATWLKFRADQFLWFRVAEMSYDNFTFNSASRPTAK